MPRKIEIEYEGKVWSIRELADHVGLCYDTLRRRLRELQLPVEEAVKKTIPAAPSVCSVKADLRKRQRKVEHQEGGQVPVPRVVNEIPYSPPAQRQKMVTHIRNIEVSCYKCGYVAKFSTHSKREIDLYRGGKWACRECKKEGQKELQQAILNLARNKKAPKR